MKADVVPLTLRVANDFVEQHHRHSSRTSNDGGKFAIGAAVDGQLVGVIIVGRPVARMLQAEDGTTAEALRCCVSGNAPDGTPSRLYARAKHIWRLMGGRRFVSYTLEHESGGSLKGAGMVETGKVKARRWTTPSRPRDAREIEQVDKRRFEAELAELPL